MNYKEDIYLFIKKMSVRDTEYYDTLNISPNCTQDDIKKSFRKLAMKWHPDRWSHESDNLKKNAEEEFKKLNEAYTVLSDENKRSHYDRFGKANENGGMEMNEEMMRDIFQNMGFGGMFRGMNQRASQKRELKMPDINVEIEVSLTDIYNGAKVELCYERMNIKKNVKQTNNKYVEQCNGCEGRGQNMRLRQIGPGMMQQMMEVCRTCEGSGIKIRKELFDMERVSTMIHIPRGIYQGERIVLDGAGHQISNDGNKRTAVNIIYKEKQQYVLDNIVYTRGVNNSPNNLHINIELEAYEGICGTVRTIRFINNEMVNIQIPRGLIFEKKNDIVVIPKMGMPIYKKKGNYGNLFVQINMKKTTMTDMQVSEIWNIMSGSQMETELEKKLKETNNKVIASFTLDQYTVDHDDDHDHDDHDDDRHRGGLPQGCAQQ